MSLLKYTFINESTKLKSVLLIFKRFRSKKVSEKNTPKYRALSHFDDFYKSVFGEKWPSVRLALLSKQKYVAVINNFGETEKAEELLQNQGALDLRQFLEVQKSFVSDSCKLKPKEESALDEVITKQLMDEEEKEFDLHPEKKRFKVVVDQIKPNVDESESNNEYVYKPEDARTSLDFDLNRAEIDKTRLILPSSALQQADLREFIPATTLRGIEEFIPESDYYKYYQPKISASINIEEEHELEFPENLKVYSFDRGDITDFPSPVRNVFNNYDYLEMDGGELLAALALGVQPNDSVLDICSSCGNIAYCIFQTLRPKFLVCTRDKNGDILNLFNDYLIDYSKSGNDVLFVTSIPAENLKLKYSFDRVLVNVPSTEDRSSLFEDEDNIFHVQKTKERLTLPENQCQLLIEGLRLVRPGGTVLYTSSTLSPVQNDGVVNQALQFMWEETRQKFVVKDLSPALRHTSVFFNYGDYLNLKFGTLVVPFLPVNFGPRYICKIVKAGEVKDREGTASANANS